MGILFLGFSPLRAQTADVIKASGATELSIDSVATQGFTSIDGPTIRETVSGQLAAGGTIALTLPDGFVWNTGLTGSDITITIEPTGAANTKLQVGFTSITSSAATFTVDRQSTTNGNGQGPGRVEIQGLQLRPDTLAVPFEKQITNTGSTGPDKNYGNLSTAVGAISQVSVETASDGSGQVVPSQDILAGDSFTVYAIGRDVGDNFVENVSLANTSDWSLVGGNGNIPQTAITSSNDRKSATFSSQTTGTTKIKAVYSEVTNVTSDLITMLPRPTDAVTINTQPSGTATAGSAFSTAPVIYLRDQFGNKVTTDNSTQVTASIASGNGTLSGTLTRTVSAGEITFTGLSANIANTITLQFSSSGITSATSNAIVIEPAAASNLTYIQQPTNTAENKTIDPPVEVQLLDSFGNKVPQSGVSVTIGSEPYWHNSTLSTTTDGSGIATFNDLNVANKTAPDTVQLTTDFSNSSPVSSDPFTIISKNALAKYSIKTTSDTDIGTQQAGTPFTVRITALNGNDNPFTFSADSTLTITADNTLEGDSSNVTILNGNSSIDTTLTFTSTGSTRLYADSSETIFGRSNTFNVTPSDSIDTNTTIVSADPGQITADGSSNATITVQIKDEFGNNLVSGGDTVQLTTDAGTFNGGVQTITANDNGDGTYSAVLTAPTTAGTTANINATVNGRSISDQAAVSFEAGEITGFSFQLPQNSGSPATQTAGVPFDIDVNAIDANGNTVPDFNGSVTFTTNSSLTTGGTATFSNGQLLNHSLTLTKADSNVTITATADNLYNITGTSASFIIQPNSPDASKSTLVATPNVLQNDNSFETVIAVILNDTYNNRVYQQQTVSLNLTQLEENNSSSPDGVAEASLANGSNIPFNNSKAVYRDTLTATTTIEIVEITGAFGNSPSTTIAQTDTVDIVVPNTWTAGAGGPSGNRTDWTNPENWSQNQVPDSTDFVIIPNISDLPILDLNIDVGSLEIQSGVSLILFGGNAITLSGNLNIDGTLDIEDNTEIAVGGDFLGSGSFSAGQSTDILIDGDIYVPSFLARTSGSHITLAGSTPQVISSANILTQNLNIQNDVNVNSANDLIDTSVLTINSGKTLELNTGANDTLDVSQEITGDGTLLINDNAIVMSGNFNLQDIDASQGTVIFGVRPGQDPSSSSLSEQQVSNLDQMKNAIVNNNFGVETFADVVVDGTLTLENGPLTISSGKSLIAPNQVYNNGNLKLQRTISSQQGWLMISAPINTDFTDFFSGSDTLTVQGITGSTYPSRQPNLLYYNETIPGTDNQRWRAPSSMSSSIQDPDSTGRGFFFYVFGDVSSDTDYNDTLPVTLEVSGQEYKHANSSFNFSSVTYTAAADTGWNLVGNPWAATLDWDAAGWTKTNIDNAVYVWDPSTNSYLTWNGIDGSLNDGLIKPFQAFWIKANGESPVLSIDKSVKTTGGNYHGKSKKKPASIGFLLETDSLSNEMHLTLTSDGSQGYDPRDAYRLLPFNTDTYLEFYTTLEDGTELAINNLARSFGKSVTIPLHLGGYKNGTPINGEYTISWPNFGKVPEAWTIKLIDREKDKKIDLRKNTFYSFDLSQSKKKTVSKNTLENFRLTKKSPAKNKMKNGSGDSRFAIRIEPGADGAGIPDEYSLGINYPNPFSEWTKIKYNTPVEGKVKLLIYDILGRRVKTLLNERRKAAYHELKWTPTQLASGVYICVMRAGGKQFTKKLTYFK
ncbi:invasin domain 3-containing protein [Fodinibius halophilus]|uniref:T9SS type A sorting domain-containing protein n=1 Tax=Fodinibius halophilus TaxID=1736908 RepID=A0A6M1SV60_9BACT|nr:invasin domain 3-containing protein [Fodinibius halophilus]NGP87818.1 T9SS type A sorting domain-containing protein [Fodinibius halophilus]